MRSSVSYMLSNGSGELIMSHPDYEQQAHHHACLLVLVRGIGPSKPRSLQKVFERVKKINNIKITDSAGITRDIWVRYVHDHPAENNDWGDFQTHRRLLGLITIGKFDTQSELNELCRLHESLKVKYVTTLYDSRSILFGPSADRRNSNNTTNILANSLHNSNSNDLFPTTEDKVEIIENPKIITPTLNHPLRSKLEDEFIPPSNFKSTAYFYPENDLCEDLDSHIEEFIASLFWILESKRLERSREKIDKFTLLLAPFEKKDFIGLDLESRNNKKRCIGRVTKNLGDLTLQAGLVAESLNLFHAASETLRAISDSLWLGAADEGLCAASAILLYPQLRQSETHQIQQFYHRNASLQNCISKLSPQKNAIHNVGADKRKSSDLTAAKKAISITNEQQKQRHQHHQQNSIDANDATVVAVGDHQSNSSSTSSVSSILTSSSSSSPTASSTSSTSSPNHQNHSTYPQRNELPANILTPEEIVNQYRRAIINYSKYRNAAIIETEATLKAARICIEQNKNLDVAVFLQNVLYINLNMTDQERIKRFEVLTELYQKIGYRRKAAFCQRLAAWKHVIKGNPTPDWSQSYRLMLESFPGYMLSLDPLEVLENAAGWPMLQIDLLQQLITAARRLGHSALATRHMTFLLQTQWEHLSSNDQREMALQLQNLSAQCEGSPVPLVLENGTVIPPANLTDIPYCLNVQVKDLSSHLRPHKIKIIKEDSGPFLFTPITMGSIDRRVNKKKENKISFQWVQHDLSEITLKLKNTLPFELTVSDMRLLTNGIVFESLPQTIILQPSIPTLVTLHGTPIEIGQLEILGYSTHTLGVKSNCRLKHMRNRSFPSNYLIDVIPALPRISAKTSLPQTATFSTLANSDSVITSASLTLFNGETTECLITLKNESNIQIDHLVVSIQSNVSETLQQKIFKVDHGDIETKLPILPNHKISFTMQIFGEADFLNLNNPVVFSGAGSTSSSSGANHHHNNDSVGAASAAAGGGGPQSLNYSSMLSSGHTSLPSRVSSPTPSNNQLAPRRGELTSSFRSSHSAAAANYGQSSIITLSSVPQPSLLGVAGNDAARQIEAQLRLKYSGGEAMENGYCRQCAISFSLELLPSAQITSWDVLPAETPSQFYLVLDVFNLTSQEMSLNYTQNKNILIEAKENCRIPIPVDRCSLEKLYTSKDDNNIKTNQNENEEYRDEVFVKQSFNEMCEKICSEHIAERVKLNWCLNGTETKGIASLKGICLSAAMMDVITIAPLQWTIMFNNTLVQPQTEITCLAGQCVVLNVSVCNLSQNPLRHLILTIQFYQDYQNGVHNYHLETRVTMSGPNQKLITCLQKNEKLQHECSVIFFTPGRFKANIQCRSMSPSPQYPLLNTSLVCGAGEFNSNNGGGGGGGGSGGGVNSTNIPISNASSSSSSAVHYYNTVKLPVPNLANPPINSHPPVAYNLYALTSDSTSFQETQHIWRFIPPLEVTVTEQ